uniref:Transmembrane protein n=1 Tax=Anguilla anguilla TaxID=7936 RepID=A0A0E9X009_ANGAN
MCRLGIDPVIEPLKNVPPRNVFPTTTKTVTGNVRVLVFNTPSMQFNTKVHLLLTFASQICGLVWLLLVKKIQKTKNKKTKTNDWKKKSFEEVPQSSHYTDTTKKDVDQFPPVKK